MVAEPRFADDDDLPRTLRRAREEQRERQSTYSAMDDAYGSPTAGEPYAPAEAYGYDYGAAVGDGTVTVGRLQIPFTHLVAFFLKAVIAAIPALILLTGLLWGMGQGLKHFIPAFRHFEIVVKSVK
jgi:hypothetical protein